MWYRKKEMMRWLKNLFKKKKREPIYGVEVCGCWQTFGRAYDEVRPKTDKLSPKKVMKVHKLDQGIRKETFVGPDVYTTETDHSAEIELPYLNQIYLPSGGSVTLNPLGFSPEDIEQNRGLQRQERERTNRYWWYDE